MSRPAARACNRQKLPQSDRWLRSSGEQLRALRPHQLSPSTEYRDSPGWSYERRRVSSGRPRLRTRAAATLIAVAKTIQRPPPDNSPTSSNRCNAWAVAKLPEGPDWVYEITFDGYRALGMGAQAAFGSCRARKWLLGPVSVRSKRSLQAAGQHRGRWRGRSPPSRWSWRHHRSIVIRWALPCHSRTRIVPACASRSCPLFGEFVAAAPSAIRASSRQVAGLRRPKVCSWSL